MKFGRIKYEKLINLNLGENFQCIFIILRMD